MAEVEGLVGNCGGAEVDGVSMEGQSVFEDLGCQTGDWNCLDHTYWRISTTFPKPPSIFYRTACGNEIIK